MTTAPGKPAPTTGLVLGRSRPVSLDVPAIGLKKEMLTSYGLDRDGVVAIPEADLQTPAGWLDRSPTPGEVGPSVIVGHVDSAKAGPSGPPPWARSGRPPPLPPALLRAYLRLAGRASAKA